MSIADTARSLVCGSLVILVIVQIGLSLAAGWIIPTLSDEIRGRDPGQRWRRSLIAGTAVAAASLAGLVVMRARACG